MGADDVEDNVGEVLVVMGAFPCILKSLFAIFPCGYNWNCCNRSSSGERFASINGMYGGFLNGC